MEQLCKNQNTNQEENNTEIKLLYYIRGPFIDNGSNEFVVVYQENSINKKLTNIAI